MATSTATSETDIQAELHRLRQRNLELTEELEKVKHDRDAIAASNKEEDVEGAASIDNKERNSGLHKRRISGASASKDNSDHNLNNSFSSGKSPRRPVKSKHSDISSTHSPSKNKIQPDSPATPSVGRSEPQTSDLDREAGFNNERSSGNQSTKKSTKKTSDGGGQYFKALSIDNGDEEGQIWRVENGPNPNNDVVEENDGLINDDSSHNKHFPGVLPSSPSSSNPLSAFPSFSEQLKERAGWLIGLLFLQSCSSFIIQYNEIFLQNHMVIVQFLTMLVGAGGNAGNQASVGVIRSLAIGTLNGHTMVPFLKREAKMALSMAFLIGFTGFIRAALFRTPVGETIAITTSVFAIVAISIGIGSTLPLGMKKVGIDPAHSSTTIQVIMDILGVLITVCVSSFVMSFKVFQSDDSEGEDSDRDL